MVFGTVQRHSADIDIDSAAGMGTTVSLRFASSAGDLQTASADASSGARAAASLRILVVDDDPLLVKSLSDALADDGHEIVVAMGGQAGIDTFLAARQAGQPFAVVLTDLGMPLVDGRQVARAVKAAAPATPVILLTGWGQRMLEKGDIPPHVDRVLSKPPRLRDLRLALSGLTARPRP
jgi:CheY-like chemotaxis protein